MIIISIQRTRNSQRFNFKINILLLQYSANPYRWKIHFTLLVLDHY